MDCDTDSNYGGHSNECFASFDCKRICCDVYSKSEHFSQHLNSLLSMQGETSVILFSKLLSSKENGIHFLFRNIKSNFFLMQSLVRDNKNLFDDKSPLIEVQKCRKQIYKDLQLFLSNLRTLKSFYSCPDKRHCNMSLSDMFSNVVKEVKDLLLCIGRVNKIINIISIERFKEESFDVEYYYHYFHMYLDIWWYTVAILSAVNCMPYRTEKFESFCTDMNHLDPSLQVITLILIDFISVTMKRFELEKPPFICECVKEFWIMLIQVLDSKSTDGKYCFWTMYHYAIQNILRNFQDKGMTKDTTADAFQLIDEHMECKDIIQLCLWLTSYIAPLSVFDKSGNYCEQGTPKSGYATLKYLIQSLLADNHRTEANLRSALFYTLKLASIWESNCEVLLPLTDFYIKRINETFSLSVIDLAYLFNTSISWFKYIDSLSDTCTALGDKTSFDFFLHVLYKQLEKDCDIGSLWRAIKGRVYSKISPKKINELSEVGLQNTFSLILAIAKSGQSDAGDKICDLASIAKTCISGKQIIAWRALFVLMHVYQKKGCNFDKIINKTVDFFNAACTEYSAAKDITRKNNIMKLLHVYINSMYDLFDMCNGLKFSEYRLVGSGFSALLSSCGITDLNNILTVFLDILTKVQNVINVKSDIESSFIEMQYTELLEFLLKHVLPCIEHLSITDTPPQFVSDLAAVFTILSYKFEFSLRDRITQNFSSIFLHFGSLDTVNSSVTCRYLGFVLDDESLQIGLNLKLSNFISILFQSWLKCVVCLQPPCDEMKSLTPKVLLQRDIVETFPEIRKLNIRTYDHDYAAIVVFRIMGKSFDESTDLKLKHQLKLQVNNCFKKYVSCVSFRIKKQHDGVTLRYVYKLTSHLVEYCSALLHMQYNPDSIMPQLFENVVFPQLIFPKEKHLQLVLSCAIKEYLPGFIKGLFKLDYRRDKFVEKAIKDIMVNFICIYTSSSNSITKLCIDSVTNKTEGLKWNEFQFLLVIIKDHVLTSSSNPTFGFELIFEVFKATPLSRKPEIASVLLKCAFESYMKQSGSLTNYLRDLMCKVFVQIKNSMNLTDSKLMLIPILQWFIQEKIPWSTARGFSVLDCISDYLPQVLSDIIPFLTKTIEDLENTRGFGIDVNLRNHLKNTVSKLQGKLSASAMSTK